MRQHPKRCGSSPMPKPSRAICAKRASCSTGFWRRCRPARRDAPPCRAASMACVQGRAVPPEAKAMRRTARFRALVEAPEILILPGAHDALSLKLIERAGFQAATCGGFASTASLLGAPDIGQLTMSEMAENYARLCDATELPIFADGDTGHGNVS